jgi:WD40 repeat protein
MCSRTILTWTVTVALLVAGCKEGRPPTQSRPSAQGAPSRQSPGPAQDRPAAESPPSQSPVTADKILDVPGIEPVVSAVALSSDGRRVAVGDMDGEIVLRELPSGTVLWKNRSPHSGPVDTLVFSPDGLLLGAITHTHSVSVREVSTGRISASMEGGGNTRSITFHPTEPVLAAGAGSNLIFLTFGSVERKRPLPTNALPGERIDGVAFSSDGRLLAAVSAQGTLKVWSWPELTPRMSLKLSKSIEAVAPVSLVLAQDTRAAVNGLHGRVHVVDIVREREEQTFDNTPRALNHGAQTEMRGSLAFSEDGNWLFAPDMHDRGLRIVDLASGRTHAVFAGDAPFYKAMSVSVPAGVVALLRPADEKGGGPFGLEVWRLTYRTP